MSIDKTIYTSSRWRKERRIFLNKNPFCTYHWQQGLKVVATIVDHVIAHRYDETIFWDQKNWQSLCKRCHDAHKQRLEKSGRVTGCDINGYPLDPAHHWRKSQQ